MIKKILEARAILHVYVVDSNNNNITEQWSNRSDILPTTYLTKPQRENGLESLLISFQAECSDIGDLLQSESHSSSESIR